jgi:hypothetical protein
MVAVQLRLEIPEGNIHQFIRAIREAREATSTPALFKLSDALPRKTKITGYNIRVGVAGVKHE